MEMTLSHPGSLALQTSSPLRPLTLNLCVSWYAYIQIYVWMDGTFPACAHCNVKFTTITLLPSLYYYEIFRQLYHCTIKFKSKYIVSSTVPTQRHLRFRTKKSITHTLTKWISRSQVNYLNCPQFQVGIWTSTHRLYTYILKYIFRAETHTQTHSYTT